MKLAVVALAVALLVPPAMSAAFAEGGFGHPQAAVVATIHAQRSVARSAYRVARTGLRGFAKDLRTFYSFLEHRFSFSIDLADNPFFEAHVAAVVASDRSEDPWDLEWAIPEDLRPSTA